MEVTLSAAAVWASIGAFLGMVVTAVTAFTMIGRPVRKMMVGWRLMMEDWHGEADRPGVPGRPGIMVRMASFDHELRTNTGSTLRDAIKRIEQEQVLQGARMDTLISASAGINQQSPNGSSGG